MLKRKNSSICTYKESRGRDSSKRKSSLLREAVELRNSGREYVYSKPLINMSFIAPKIEKSAVDFYNITHFYSKIKHIINHHIQHKKIHKVVNRFSRLDFHPPIEHIQE